MLKLIELLIKYTQSRLRQKRPKNFLGGISGVAVLLVLEKELKKNFFHNKIVHQKLSFCFWLCHNRLLQKRPKCRKCFLGGTLGCDNSLGFRKFLKKIFFSQQNSASKNFFLFWQRSTYITGGYNWYNGTKFERVSLRRRRMIEDDNRAMLELEEVLWALESVLLTCNTTTWVLGQFVVLHGGTDVQKQQRVD
jgi:hypothetical protein